MSRPSVSMLKRLIRIGVPVAELVERFARQEPPTDADVSKWVIAPEEDFRIGYFTGMQEDKAVIVIGESAYMLLPFHRFKVLLADGTEKDLTSPPQVSLNEILDKVTRI